MSELSGSTVRLEPTLAVAPTARNAAILQAARGVLAAALEARTNEASIRAVEDAADWPPARSLRRIIVETVWRVGTLFLAVDAAAVVAAWLVPAAPIGIAPLAVSLLVLLAIARRADMYRSRLELSVLDDVPSFLVGAALAVGCAAGTEVSLGQVPTLRMCLAVAGWCFALLALGRSLAYAAVRRLRRSRLISHPVVVVGAGDVGQQLAGAMLGHPEYGLAPVGFIDTQTADIRSALGVLPTLGGLSALLRARDELGVRDVVFAFAAQPDVQVVRVVRACVRMNMQVFVVPRYFELFGANRHAHIETLWGVPLVRLRRWPLRSGPAFMKRTVDVVVAALSLVVLSPLMAACAIAVRLESGPGVIFTQIRTGRYGKPFILYKFRSMRPRGGEGDRRWSIEGDAAVGPVGRLLRRTSLDELPQLVNVLRGDMSIVGPRPERPYFAQTCAQLIHRYGDRLRLAGGLTGFAQVNGLRGDTSIRDRVTFDNHYIDNWSLWIDIKIMLRTLPALARRAPKPSAAVHPGDREPGARRRS
jgi:exopolysaccharide biosynthesis polyprenyl glycosylphosphotransferase